MHFIHFLFQQKKRIQIFQTGSKAVSFPIETLDGVADATENSPLLHG